MTLLDLPFMSGVAAPAVLIVGEVARQANGETSKDLKGMLDPVLAFLSEQSERKNPGLNVEASSQS